MTTHLQDKDFISSLIPKDLLQGAIDWISENMDPEDVFTKQDLEAWAEDWGYVKADRYDPVYLKCGDPLTTDEMICCSCRKE